jgi:hypothetical protein
MSSSARSRRWSARILAVGSALLVAASVSTAGARAVDPIVYDVTPPLQLTTPGNQVGITFTIADTPPCGNEETTTLDSLDFELTDPSGLSTIASFTTSEPPGSVSSNLSPDMRALTLLFDSAFPCLNGVTESITVVVTLDVPAGVPSGTQLTLEGDARGFAAPPGTDYVLTRTGLVLVAPDIPRLPPPPPPDPGGNGGLGSGGGGSTGGGAIAAPSGSAVAATAVSATPRFTG